LLRSVVGYGVTPVVRRVEERSRCRHLSGLARPRDARAVQRLCRRRCDEPLPDARRTRKDQAWRKGVAPNRPREQPEKAPMAGNVPKRHPQGIVSAFGRRAREEKGLRWGEGIVPGDVSRTEEARLDLDQFPR